MSPNTFDEDLNLGNIGEKHILKEIRQQYPAAIRIDAYFPYYDIWIPEINKSVEVKFDKASLTTQNFLFELECSNKPSGIIHSTADWWVIFDGFTSYYIERERMLKVLIMSQINWIELYNPYRKVILLPINQYKNIFKNKL